MVLKEDNLLPKCIVCDDTPQGGIKEGILVSRRFICFTCERKIIKSTIDDHEYLYYKECLKKVWC